MLLTMDARIHSLEQQVQGLTTRLDLSDKRVRHLEEQLAKNSRNSSKPPSSDPNREKKPRKKGNKKPGGQKGHIGKTLEKVDNPDKVEVLKVNQTKLPKG